MTQKNQVKKLRDQDALLRHIDGLMKDTGKYYILIDEIQLDKEFEDVLNSYLGISNAEVYVTGSECFLGLILNSWKWRPLTSLNIHQVEQMQNLSN